MAFSFLQFVFLKAEAPCSLDKLIFSWIVLFSLQARGKEAIVAGFYHEGYEEPLLMLMRRRGVHAGLVVKVLHDLKEDFFFGVGGAVVMVPSAVYYHLWPEKTSGNIDFASCT